MKEITYNGKTYRQCHQTVLDAFASAGMYAFFIYPQEDLMILPKATQEAYHAEEFYPNMPFSLANALLLKEDQERYFHEYRQVALGAKDKTVIKVRLKNGRTWVRHTFAVTERDEDGKPLVIVGTVEDVSHEMKNQLEKNELISSFSNIYYVMYELELETGCFREIVSTEAVRALIPPCGKLSDIADTICENFCSPEYHSRLATFLDIRTLRQRLLGKGIITIEYAAATVDWAQAAFLPVGYNEDGSVSRVIFAVRNISDSRERDFQLHNLIEALALSYQNLYTVNMDNESIHTYYTDNLIRGKFGNAIATQCYQEVLSLYIDSEVYKDDVHLFDPIRTIAGCKAIFEKSKEYTIHYRSIKGGCIRYFFCQLVKPSESRNEFAVGFKNEDADVEAQMARQVELQNKVNTIEEYNRIIRALSQDCTSAYHIDLKTGRFQLIGMDNYTEYINSIGKELSSQPFDISFRSYIEQHVDTKDMERVRDALSIGNLRQALRNAPEIMDTFHAEEQGQSHIYQYRAVRIFDRDDEPQEAVVMFRIVDNIVKKEEQSKKMLEEQVAVISGLAADYYSVMLVDYLNDTVSIRGAREGDGTQIADFFSQYPTWSEGVRAYADSQVVESERESFYRALSLEAIRNGSEDYSYNYQKVVNETACHLQFKVAYVQTEAGSHFAVVGTRNIEREHMNHIALQKAKEELDRRYSMISALSQEYHTLWLCSNDGTDLQLVRTTGKSTIKNALKLGIETPFIDVALERYGNTYVDEIDRERMLRDSRFQVVLEKTANNSLYSINYLRRMEDGQSTYHQMTFARAVREDGDFDVILGFRDVDDMVRAEQEKRRILRDALASAEHANHAKTTFLSNMSHDIRTPMNAIMGFTTLAMTHLDNREAVQDYLSKIATSSSHLLSLINDVLDMSRIESGRMHLEETECNLSDILHDLRNILLADLRRKNLNLFIDTVDVFDEKVICDKLRLNQILLNIVGNAMKFTDVGGRISIRLIQKPGVKREIANYEFHIKDTGIGMSKEFVTRIFEPFERERSSTISGIQGTGLGMAITKNIVDMMNGTIAVESEKGVGSEFIVTIPMEKIQQEESGIVIEELKGAHALVVDDDFNTCDSVTNILIQMGMRADWSMSGKESVLRCKQALKRNDPYRVYVIDWLIPDMNGIEIARNIRREVGSDVPIIILTAYDWSDIEEEARAAGVTAFVSKPLFISDIRRCLMNILHPQDSDAENPLNKSIQALMGKRLLMVEDNDLNREIASELLAESGLIVEEAVDGTYAVEILLKKGAGYYDAVLMDIQMPIMDGYTATRKIRAFSDPRLSSIPIVAMTANAFEEDKKKAVDAGMNGHVSKPIHLEKLLAVLESLI